MDDDRRPMTDLEEAQLKKILDEFQERWNSPHSFARWGWASPELDPAPVKTETVIGAEEILEGFDGV